MSGVGSENLAGSAGAGAITLLAGTTFCVAAANGDMLQHLPHGVFFHDTRFISHWTLTLDGEAVDALGASTPEPFRSVHICRAARAEGLADTRVLVERRRRLDGGLGETIIVRNYSTEPFSGELKVDMDADFADLFEVKAAQAHKPRGEQVQAMHHGTVTMESWRRGRHREVTVSDPNATIRGRSLCYDLEVTPRGNWSTQIKISPTIDGIGPEMDVAVGEQHTSSAAAPEQRLLDWRGQVPMVETGDSFLVEILERSRRDLGSLRIFDDRHAGRMVIAAGAPWFLALFGRDSLLSSYMSMALDPMLALGTLQALAEHQGRIVRHRSEEQPGRILHEVRLGSHAGLALDGGVYYGTVDATPLFVVLAAELVRWGYQEAVLTAVLPAIDKAMEWIQGCGDQDGDGFVEYRRATRHGLVNQGWKDSWDGINFADGTLATAPIALCEVQGYVYAAYRSRAQIAETAGDKAVAAQWRDRAALLKDAFNDRFWLPEKGWFAVALDHEKRPVDACASNMGHCLWTGIVDDDKAPQVARQLLSQEMFSGWGIRTLASTMGAYNPASYHNGSVWPHDNALIVTGLMRYGFVDEAQRVAAGLLDAAEHFAGRLPELFCGFDRDSYPVPVPYPTACSPQAWASAAPVQLLRALLRFEPDVPSGTVTMDPALLERTPTLRVHNLPLAGTRISLDIHDGSVSVEGLPVEVQFNPTPRPGRAPWPDI